MSEPFFGTKEVAQILGIPEWRVKNFAQGPAYGLPPAQKLGVGYGSRRLYGVNGVLWVAIATELVGFGFTPEAVGQAMTTVKNEEVARVSAEVRALKPDEILVCVSCKWELKRAKQASNEVARVFSDDRDWPGVFGLNVSKLVACVLKKVEAYAKRGVKAEEQR
jgi:hypothetical protein